MVQGHMEYTPSEYVPLMKALADETRLRIVDMLSCGEMCACDLLESFDITQPTLSYHMKVLTASGLVKGRHEGSWMHYKLDEACFIRLAAFLQDIATETEECICKFIPSAQPDVIEAYSAGTAVADGINEERDHDGSRS